MSHHANDAKIYYWAFKDIGVALDFDWRTREWGGHKVNWVCRPGGDGGRMRGWPQMKSMVWI